MGIINSFVLTNFVEEIVHILLLHFDYILSLFFKCEFELVVDEGDDHAVVDRDHIGGNMVMHLRFTLHKQECSIC